MGERGWNRHGPRRGGFGRGNFGPGWRGRGDRSHARGGPRGRFQGNNQYGDRTKWYNRQKRDTPGKRLCEQDIGVTEYVSDHVGFNGIIKSRYSDFQVSEINHAGEVAKLTDMTAPTPPIDDTVVEDEDLLLSKYNVELLPMETWDRINKLAVSVEAISEKVQVDVTGMSKEQRTKIHDAVKKAFGEAIVGSTVTTEDRKFVSFEKYRKGVRIDNRVKWAWPGEYVHFVVHKENCDTMDAANKIADRLKLNNVKPSQLGYAGTKDRRAKTTQWFSLRRIEPKRIVNAVRDNMRELHVGNFRFSKTHLKLGMLKGNKFRIALRNVTAPDATVERACAELRRGGFVNYYGLQRFGTRALVPTYDIGLRLLTGKFDEAIKLILDEREGNLEEALQTYKTTGSAAAACRHVPRAQANSLESRVLSALARDPHDYTKAVDRIPRNTRLLYTHSYQSLVWNRCVSERLRRHGLKPSVGDLVLVGDTADCRAEESLEDEDSDSEENQDGDKETPEPAPKPPKPDRNAPKPTVPVRVLTQEDIDGGKYTIFDIIMPLPGFHIEYPPNMLEYYEEILKKDGCTLDMKHKNRSYSMSGAYRPVVVRPSDVTWATVRYNDPYGDLILSDLDELNNKTLDAVVEDGKFKAVILSLTLPASCYATMALREILRVDTSGESQASQNNYHKTDNGKADEEKGQDDTEGSKSEGEKRKLDDEKGDEETEAKRMKQEEVMQEDGATE